MKKILLSMLAMAAVFAGTFAAWQYGIVHTAWREANSLMAGVLGREPAASGETAVAVAAAAEPPQEARGAMLSAALVPAPGSAPADGGREPAAPVAALRPPAAEQAAPAIPAIPAAPANDAAPIDVAALSSRSPLSVPAAAIATAVAERPVAPAPETASVRPSAPASALPVLSDAKAQLRVIDQMLSSDPSEALSRLNDLLATGLDADDAAEAGYRKGFAARVLRDEGAAETFWSETAAQFPAQRGGRLSAMALADTWFQLHAAGNRADTRRWDDISILYSQALGRDDAPFLPEAVKRELKRKIGIVNNQVLFGPAPGKLARYHRVESGELLGGIANKYRVDYESIARVNGVNPNRIGVGTDLKLIVGDVEVIVRKYAGDPNRTPTVTWFIDGRWAREYDACVGDGVKTPAGTYTFTSKERDPSWTNPSNGQLLPNDHPENILGSRWMAMKGMGTQGLGIHGTTVDDSIPGYTSAGCVRLHNGDVEELFSFARIGGKVTILE